MGTGSSDLTPPRPPEGRPPPGPNVYQPTGALRIPGHRPGQQHSGSQRPMTVVQKTKMVRNLCNVRRDSLRLVRDTGQGAGADRFFLELRYSAEVPCTITAYFLHEEAFTEPSTPSSSDSRLSYRPRYPDRDCVVGPVNCPAGHDQPFHSQQSVDLSNLADRDYTAHDDYFPLYVVIRPQAADLSEVGGGAEISSQVTCATLSRSSFHLKFVKQKIETASGAVFVLQEIYGIAKEGEGGAGPDDSESSAAGDVDAQADDVSNADCVICLTNKRELTVLPCRHMCVCRYCATECFQSQESKCPICRNPAQALLKLTVGQTTDNSVGTLKTE